MRTVIAAIQGRTEAGAKSITLRLGAFSVRVRSELDHVLEDVETLYPASVQCHEGGHAPSIEMEIRLRRRRLPAAQRCDVLGDGEQVFTHFRPREAFPYLEWGINRRVIASGRRFLQVHAATLARQGAAILLCGPSGSGKSTLAAALLSRGWQYLSDEFALIDPETLHVHSFPKALCIKEGAFDLIRDMGLPLHRRRHYVNAFKGPVGYVSPFGRPGHESPADFPVRSVLLLAPRSGGRPSLSPVSRAEAALQLTAQVLNRPAFGLPAAGMLCDLVRGCSCLALRTGDLENTCTLVEYH